MFFKKFRLRMSVIVLVFGMTVLGCASTGPKINYYNLGDVSEEDCALIVVSPTYQIYDTERSAVVESDFTYSDFVKIDGQGGREWSPPPGGFFDIYSNAPEAVVRVTPGTHTFTITFIFSDEFVHQIDSNLSGGSYEVPVNITYDCKAGKKYIFTFLAKHPEKSEGMGLLTMSADGDSFIRLEDIDRAYKANTTIIISEAGNGSGSLRLTTTSTDVARKTEAFNFNPNDRPNDRGRLVRR